MKGACFVGVDLGTSGVKAVLVDVGGSVRASATRALQITHPHPRWSEQDPAAWWDATLQAIDDLLRLAKQRGIAPSRVAGIGLSGQMHGATLLDRQQHVLRPAILWNDGRSDAECAELEALPDFRAITGNLAMPGFTAPKLIWVQRHEPQIFERIDKVLLPKDYLRLRLTGEFASDASDAAGTLWLDVAKRVWSDRMLAACGLTREQMPAVLEGTQSSGTLLPELTARWGFGRIPVAAGGGDNAAGAVGMGVVRAGQAMLSLGTSGVFFVVLDEFLSRPTRAVHSFCHALPKTWHLMSVMLNAASCLDFTARITGQHDVAALLAEAEANGLHDDGPLFLPHLTGERTPYNDVYARGSFSRLHADITRADLGNAVLEGVGLGLLEGMQAVIDAGVEPTEISVVGGGARSAYWMHLLADILGRPLTARDGGEVGPALGAARLAHVAVEPGAQLSEVCPTPRMIQQFEPNPARAGYFREHRLPLFRETYQALRQRPLDDPLLSESSHLSSKDRVE